MNTSFALAPLSALYGAAVRARLALYRGGALRQERAGAPVISVGNITAGGTGKTPLVEWVARAVAREGRRACVLTRGYGRRDERLRVVVSDGERLLADAPEAGDEPRMLAEQLLGVASVVSDADRAAAARWALENLRAQAFVMDDGFQHLRLARDLDVVALDATAPWGGGHLLPRGRLREPRRGIGRADCVVITRADLAGDAAARALREEVSGLCGGAALVVEARARTTGLRRLADDTAGDEFVSAADVRSVGAFCAVGNPQSFFEHLRRDGHEPVLARAFTDHHAYTQSDLDSLTRAATEAGAHSLLTTAKDAVKLRRLSTKLPIYVVEIALEIDEEEKLLELVRGALAKS
ncbi:MAG TPA: tetraacyldisaccharide 4'-kinase [Pyrinomonadaceae bacterium]